MRKNFSFDRVRQAMLEGNITTGDTINGRELVFGNYPCELGGGLFVISRSKANRDIIDVLRYYLNGRNCYDANNKDEQILEVDLIGIIGMQNQEHANLDKKLSEAGK